MRTTLDAMCNQRRTLLVGGIEGRESDPHFGMRAGTSITKVRILFAPVQVGRPDGGVLRDRPEKMLQSTCYLGTDRHVN